MEPNPTQPIAVGKKKFKSTRPITKIQPNPHKSSWTHGLNKFIIIIIIIIIIKLSRKKYCRDNGPESYIGTCALSEDVEWIEEE